MTWNVSDVLDKRHRAAGIRLVEIDDHFLWLTDPHGRLAPFHASAAMPEEIAAVADCWLQQTCPSCDYAAFPPDGQDRYAESEG